MRVLNVLTIPGRGVLVLLDQCDAETAIGKWLTLGPYAWRIAGVERSARPAVLLDLSGQLPGSPLPSIGAMCSLATDAAPYGTRERRGHCSHLDPCRYTPEALKGDDPVVVCTVCGEASDRRAWRGGTCS